MGSDDHQKYSARFMPRPLVDASVPERMLGSDYLFNTEENPDLAWRFAPVDLSRNDRLPITYDGKRSQIDPDRVK